MISLNQAIVVEGKYDKIKLSSIIDAPIIVTDGFSLMKDTEKCDLIRFFAKKHGIIILTDSDSAGFKIRNYIKSFVNEGKITNVYIPDVFGKEKRKAKPSKEGKIGVEGISNEMLIEAFNKSGIFENKRLENRTKITKAHLYEDGLFGRENSSQMRKLLIDKLNLPSLMTTNSLLEVLNSVFDYEEYKKIIDDLESEKFGIF